MAKIIRAHINNAMLKWARERAHLTPDEMADKLRQPVERYLSWESGEGKPTLNQLRSIADKLNRSMGFFYRSAPPEEREILREMRRLPGTNGYRESSALTLHTRLTLERRDLVLNLYQQVGESPPAITLELSLLHDAENVAPTVRGLLGVDIGEQLLCSDDYKALNLWRSAIEKIGILVFQVPSAVKLGEMRGFCISQRPLPIIGINAGDGVRGRIFTLLHELGHVFLNDTVIHSGSSLYHISDQDTEVWCNRFAAAVLVPREHLLAQELVQYRGARGLWMDYEVSQLASRYRVSGAVMIRRLNKFDLVANHVYEALREHFDNYRGTSSGSGGNFYNNTLSRLDGLLPRLAFRSYYSDKITMRDLASIMGTKVQNLGEFESRLFDYNMAFRSTG